MLRLILIMTIVFTATVQAETVKEFNGNEIQLNGLRVSARQHWNLSSPPEVLFCERMGFAGAREEGTLIMKTSPQKLSFFSGLHPTNHNNDDLRVRNSETTVLERVFCSSEQNVPPSSDTL